MLKIANVDIAGISTAVPENKVNNHDLSSVYGEEETEKLIASTGVVERHVSDSISSADLCYEAAYALLNKLKWSPESVGAILFVSQTASYQLPATACVLQEKLGLSSDTIAYDVCLGCSGYVYGLFQASTLVNAGINRVLLLVGDTISQIVKSGDRATEFLFGDAGSATAITKHNYNSLQFKLGSDGSGAEHIMAKKVMPVITGAKDINDTFLTMDGAEVFAFTLKRVPSLIKSFLEELLLSVSDIDACVYHQANQFILQHLAKKSKFSQYQVPLSLMKYGNTSGASIPLTICSQSLQGSGRLLLVGFGVGLSWGVVYGDFSNTQILPVKEVKSE